MTNGNHSQTSSEIRKQSLIIGGIVASALLIGSVALTTPSDSLAYEMNFFARAAKLFKNSDRATLGSQILAAGEQIAHSPTPDERSNAYARRAFLYVQQMSYGQALSDYGSAIAVPGISKEQRCRDYELRAIFFLSRMDIEAAESNFDSAVKVDPEDFDARYQRAWTRRYLGQWTDAISDFRKLLPQLPILLSHRRKIIEEATRNLDGRERQAAVAGNAVTDRKTIALIHKGLAEAFRGLHEYGASLRQYDLALRACPVNPDLFSGRARTYFAELDWRAGLQDLWKRTKLVFAYPRRQYSWPCITRG